MRRFAVGLAALLAALLAIGGTHTLAQSGPTTDIEPNNSCAAPESLGAFGGAMSVSGAIEAGLAYPNPYPYPYPYPSPTSPPSADPVDFFSLSAPAGTNLRIEVLGAPSGQGTLPDPMLGIFETCSYPQIYNDTQSSKEPSAIVTVPPSGALTFAVAAFPDYSLTTGGYFGGSYTVRVTEVELIAGISGTIVDTTTGQPPPEVPVVELYTCSAEDCKLFSSTSAYGGVFSFTTTPYFPLLAGSYKIVIRPTAYADLTIGPFSVAKDELKDLADLRLTPLPLIGSIRGRLVNAQSHRPIDGASVYLVRCRDGICAQYTGYASVAPDGTFRFEPGPGLPQLAAGEYMLNFSANQYQPGSFGPFTVEAGEHSNLGDVVVQPNPVQIFSVRGCPPIPARGGDCRYTIKLVNGRSQTTQVQAWSTIDVFGPLSGTFQPESAQTIKLRPGQSKLVSFTLTVPRSVPNFTSFCGDAYVADRARGFYFQPLGRTNVFCSVKGQDGVTRQVSDEEVQTLLQGARNTPDQ